MLLTVHLTVMYAVWLQMSTDAVPVTNIICGRKLNAIMAEICLVYNSPVWDVPTVVDQQTSLVRKKRSDGIANQCCDKGCTKQQLYEFCNVAATTETSLKEFGQIEMVVDRSAEQDGVASAPAPTAMVGSTRRGETREVGRRRSRGYGRARARRRCWCRRKRRSGRRFSLMGNMELIRNVVRAAPVVGTVSPLLTWGRTLYTDLPPIERRRYIAVYK